ncbi:MAG: hypothetical protein ABI833_07650, partial [Acidobacteriota bacterium]
MTFTSTAAVVLPFTTDLESVEYSIQGILDHRFRGSTQIREGIYEAADYFIGSERSPRRRAIVVITDNLGGHKRSEAAAVTNLWEADAVLSGIVTPRHIPRGLPRPRGFPDDPIDPIAERLLERSSAGIDGIAQKTGGDALHSDAPGAALAEMMHRIRSRYSLYYRMPEGSPGSLRSIRVELSSKSKGFPSGQVQARRGYRIRGRQGADMALLNYSGTHVQHRLRVAIILWGLLLALCGASAQQSNPTSGSFAQIVSGAGITTTITLVNTGGTSAQVHLRFLTDEG